MSQESDAALNAVLKAIETAANLITTNLDHEGASTRAPQLTVANELLSNVGPALAELRQMTASKQAKGFG